MPPRSSFPHYQILQDRLHSPTLHHGKFEIFLGPGFGGRIPAHSSPQMPVKCPFCPKEVTWSGRNKHIFGREHLVECVKPALLKQDSWRKDYGRLCPKLDVGDDTRIQLCFGCKRAKGFIEEDHLRKCPHSKDHFTAVNALVGEVGISEVEQPVAQSQGLAGAGGFPSFPGYPRYPGFPEPKAIVVGSIDLSDYEIVRIKVSNIMVDGQPLYIDPLKSKLYDKKFKYVGRLQDGVIVDHPDSDAEL